MNKLLFVLAFIFWSNLSTAQTHITQLKRWYFSPKNVDMTQPTPSVGNISGASLNVSQIVNGAYDRYDPSGPPMFFIADNTVFDKTGNAMSGSLLSPSLRTSEIVVVPAVDNDVCVQNKYFIIYASFCACPGNTTDILLHEVDMSGNGGLGTVSSPLVLTTLQTSEFVGLAAGHANGTSHTRNIYVVGGNPAITGFQQTITKIALGNNGSATVTNLFTSTTEDFSTLELDINYDETLLAFATINENSSSANRYHIFHLFGTSGLVSFSVGNANTTTEGRGVEFYKDPNGQEKLMVGNGSNGLWVIDPNNPTNGQTQIAGSGNYGFGQLELGYNGFMYAGKASNIGAVDLSFSPPILNTAYDIALVPPTVIVPGAAVSFPTLPDQLDYENYDALFTRDNPATVDLMIKDNTNPNDIGIESNPDQGPMWISPSIVTRNTSTFGPSENIEYQNGVTRYVYV